MAISSNFRRNYDAATTATDKSMGFDPNVISPLLLKIGARTEIIIVQLSNPQSLKPPLKFGTVPWTYTDNALRKHYPSMHLHMKQYNERDVREGVNSVKRG